jgi:ATP-binding cassette, subfamily B, bacterial HlyB/CyaB
VSADNAEILLDNATERVDTGLASLMLIARYHDVPADAKQIAHDFAKAGASMDETSIVLAARSVKLKARIVNVRKSRLETLPYPVIAKMRNGEFVVVGGWREDGLIVQDTTSGNVMLLPQQNYMDAFTGTFIFIASQASITGNVARFDFSWFVPAIVKYRRELGETLFVSLVLQLLALATPFFFQVITDKVLVNKAASTLQVLSIGLLCAYIFETLLSALRTYVFSHTTNRVDVELGARLFRHLLSLPINYFHARRVGDSVARVRELENIRDFLTGNAVTVVLDLLFSVVFLGIMLVYSTKLSMIVFASLPIYVIISVIYTPLLRRRLEEKFNRGAENQSFLVETISGVETVKAGAVEPQWQRKWDLQLASYVNASFRAMNTGTIAGAWVTFVGRVVTVLIMWLGAIEVIEGRLTIGELIAFNMFAQHVSGPVLRLAQLWNDFQQVGISMQRLGDILNTPGETGSAQVVLPRIKGKVDIKDVYFRYNVDAPDVLHNVSLSIAPGEVVGVVGRSGSGKSTLTKLVQRLQVPRQGRVMIDDVDLSTVDTASLRRQVGVVLQENVLFSRSIRDNIALSDPVASIESVIEAATLAGAHEFISELPAGYDTLVGEHGSTLSGGQRQRIAIARALLSQPRILIFDEATSALDYESERAIQKNMAEICKGRTVIIIAHRLSAVRNADRIIVFERGKIIEEGAYQDLASRPGGAFARLLSLQNAGD